MDLTIQTWIRPVPDGPTMQVATVYISDEGFTCQRYDSVTEWAAMSTEHEPMTGARMDLHKLRTQLREDGFVLHNSAITHLI